MSKIATYCDPATPTRRSQRWAGRGVSQARPPFDPIATEELSAPGLALLQKRMPVGTRIIMEAPVLGSFQGQTPSCRFFFSLLILDVGFHVPFFR